MSAMSQVYARPAANDACFPLKSFSVKDIRADTWSHVCKNALTIKCDNSDSVRVMKLCVGNQILDTLRVTPQRYTSLFIKRQSVSIKQSEDDETIKRIQLNFSESVELKKFCQFMECQMHLTVRYADEASTLTPGSQREHSFQQYVDPSQKVSDKGQVRSDLFNPLAESGDKVPPSQASVLHSSSSQRAMPHPHGQIPLPQTSPSQNAVNKYQYPSPDPSPSQRASLLKNDRTSIREDIPHSQHVEQSQRAPGTIDHSQQNQRERRSPTSVYRNSSFPHDYSNMQSQNFVYTQLPQPVSPQNVTAPGIPAYDAYQGPHQASHVHWQNGAQPYHGPYYSQATGPHAWVQRNHSQPHLSIGPPGVPSYSYMEPTRNPTQIHNYPLSPHSTNFSDFHPSFTHFCNVTSRNVPPASITFAKQPPAQVVSHAHVPSSCLHNGTEVKQNHSTVTMSKAGYASGNKNEVTEPSQPEPSMDKTSNRNNKRRRDASSDNDVTKDTKKISRELSTMSDEELKQLIMDKIKDPAFIALVQRIECIVSMSEKK